MHNYYSGRRGCGDIKENAFYLKSPMGGSGDSLWSWTSVLGDHTDGQTLHLSYKPRGHEVVDPAGTLAALEHVHAQIKAKYRTIEVEGEKTEEIVGVDSHTSFEPVFDWEWGLYKKFMLKTKVVGFGDHVGKKDYTAHAFASETSTYGVSRRISKSDAALYALAVRAFGAMPILFTHSEIPELENEAHAQEALDHCERNFDLLDRSEYSIKPTWQMDDWGMYAASGQNPGRDQFMVPVLALLDKVKTASSIQKHTPIYDAKKFFDGCVFNEQAFGASWVTAVVYTLGKDGIPAEIKDLAESGIIELINVAKEDG